MANSKTILALVLAAATLVVFIVVIAMGGALRAGLAPWPGIGVGVLAIAAFAVSRERRSFVVAGLLGASEVVGVVYALIRTEFLRDSSFPGPIFGIILGLPIFGLAVAAAVGATRDRRSSSSTPRVPRRVRIFSRVLEFLLAAGVPLGGNRLVTIRGRKSGLPRTTPLAIIEVGGRRWVWAPWGEVHWVKNLRAAGRATIIKRGRREEVTATELDPTQRVEFFCDVLGPKARGIPLGVWFIRIVDGVDLNRPVEAAKGRRVFELHPLP